MTFIYKRSFRLHASCLTLRALLPALILSVPNIQTIKAQSSPDNPALQQLLETKDLKTALVGVYVYDDSCKKRNRQLPE